MSHRDRMTTAHLHAVLSTSLHAVLRYPANRDDVNEWTAALERALGAGRVERPRLLAALDRAAADRSTKGTAGDIRPADVLLAYARVDTGTHSEPVWPEYCERGCHAGDVTMIDPDGYEVMVPCDCAQGEYRQRTHLRYRLPDSLGCRSSGGQPARTVGDLLREPGWRMLLHEAPAVSAAQAEWVNAELADGKPIRETLARLRATSARRQVERQDAAEREALG